MASDPDLDLDLHAPIGHHDDLNDDIDLSAAISGISGATKRKEIRSVPAAHVSEFAINTRDEKVRLHELMGSLDSSNTTTGELKKQLRTVNKRQKVLDTPLNRYHQDSLSRSAAYEQTCKEVTKWEPIVEKNRQAEQIEFPLEKPSIKVHTTSELRRKFQPYTPLEKEIATLLHGSEHVLPEKQGLTRSEQRALQAMDIEEAKQRRADLQKFRALLSYKEARAKRQKKIKSKQFHRILNKERKKEEEKSIERLKEKDPELLKNKLEKADKSRIQERMSLKHLGGSKKMKQKMIYAKYDKDSRLQVDDMLQKSRELRQKNAVESDSEEETPVAVPVEQDTKVKTFSPWTNSVLGGQQNPWLKPTKEPVKVSAYSRPEAVLAPQTQEEEETAEEVEVAADASTDVIRRNIGEEIFVIDNARKKVDEIRQVTKRSAEDQMITRRAKRKAVDIDEEEEDEEGDLNISENVEEDEDSVVEAEKTTDMEENDIVIEERDNSLEKNKTAIDISESSTKGQKKRKKVKSQMTNEKDSDFEQSRKDIKTRPKAELKVKNEKKESKSEESEEMNEGDEIDNIFNSAEGKKKRKKEAAKSRKLKGKERKTESKKDRNGGATKRKDDSKKNKKAGSMTKGKKRKLEDNDCSDVDESGLTISTERKRTLEDMDILAEKSAEDAVDTSKTVKKSSEDDEDDDFDPETNLYADLRIDPSNYMVLPPKDLRSRDAPLVVEGEEDDAEDVSQFDLIAEAFADDDVMSEFTKEKSAIAEQDKPKAIDLTLPGWGNWGGTDLPVNRRKRKKFLVKPPRSAPRKDSNLKNVIISEKKDSAISKHQVSWLPHQYKNVHQFESSIRAPLGRTWNPETSVRELTKPKVVTYLGTIINPMDSSQKFTKDKVTNAPVGSKRRRGKN